MASNIKMNYNLARNDLARVFVFRDGVFKAGVSGEFLNCLGVDGLSQDRGDITKIECPSPIRYGEFVEVMALPGEISRMTTSLSGRMSRTELSLFYQLFDANCAFDLHLHYGQCQRPDAFNQYDKALVFEDVYVTSFSTDPLTAMTSGDRAVVNESVDISIGSFYEVVALVYGVRDAAVTTHGQVVAIKMCDVKSCGGECDDPSNGTQKGFAATTDGYLYYTNDAGVNWTAVTVQDGAGTPATPTAGIVDLACYRDYVVLLETDGDLWYIDREGVLAGTDTVFSIVASGLGGNGAAIDTFLNDGYVVGAGGDIVAFTGQDVGTVAVESQTAEDLAAVNVGPSGTVVAVGANGTVVYSEDGVIWLETSASPTAAGLSAVVVKSERNWIVGAVDGTLWATDNAGVSWTQVAYPGYLSASTDVNDLAFSTSHVLWMAQDTKLFRSVDGGNTWVEEPSNGQSTITLTNAMAIGTSIFDPNFVLVGGDVSATASIVGGTPA